MSRRCMEIAVTTAALFALFSFWVMPAAASPPDDSGNGYDGSLEYQGGYVQHDPTFYAIFWLPSGAHYEPGIIDGDFGNTSTGYLGYAGLMDRYLKDAGSTGAARVVSQYYDTKSGFARSIGTSYSFGGDWHDTTAYPHSGTGSDPLTDADIRGAVNRALVANSSWKDGINSTFFVFTGLGIESCLNAATCTLNVSSAASHYCAYHNSFTDAAGHSAIYANMPEVEFWVAPNFGEGCHGNNSLPNGDVYADNEFSSLSHELFEAATDPDQTPGQGGWRDNTSEDEIADPCAGHLGYLPYFGPSNTNVNGHLYTIQEEANNDGGDCSQGLSQPGDGSYYLLYGPYTATAGSGTGSIALAQTVLAPNRNCCGTDNPSVDWGDGTSSEPGGDSGCVVCNLTGSHTYAFNPNATYPKTYTVTVTYWTGLNTCPLCILRTDTQRSISLHIIVFHPTTSALTINADNQSMLYGGAVPPLTANVSGFINGDTRSVVTGLTCGATDGQGHPVSSTTPVGTYAITCSNATAPSYYAISYAAGTLTVNRAPLTITADDKTKAYGAQLPASTWTGTGWVNGQGPGTLTTQPTCTTSATAQSHVSGNPYSITCSGAAAANYVIGYAAGKLTVTAAPLTVMTADKTMPYGGPLPALTVSYSGLVNGDTAASVTTPPTCATTATTSSHVSGNPYSITCSGAVDTDYSIGYVAGTLTIQPVSLAVTANNKEMTYGGNVPALDASVVGLISPDTFTSLAGTCGATVGGKAASSATPGGTYAGVIACFISTTDYSVVYTAGTLKVDQAASTATLGTSGNPTMQGQQVTFTATISPEFAGTPGGTVTFRDGAATLGSRTLVSGQASFSTTGLSIGSHTITVSYGGDNNFVASGSSPLTQYVDTNISKYLSKGVYTLSNLNLLGAYLAHADLVGATIKNTNLKSADLSGAALSHSILADANLMGANLSGATLIGAIVTGTNFGSAKLVHADLTGAKVTNTNFNGADLTGATLTGATLSGVGWNATTCPDGTNSNNHGRTCLNHLTP
jgi:hypothetical protein